MTLNHGHLVHDTKAENLHQKSKLAIAHAAACKNNLFIHTLSQEAKQALPLQVDLDF
jgi:hypothetical protein